MLDIERRKLGTNWAWDVDPKLRWSTGVGRGNPNTQAILPLNNKYALMCQFKFMAPVYIFYVMVWIYMDRMEPVWLDPELFTYVEKE